MPSNRVTRLSRAGSGFGSGDGFDLLKADDTGRSAAIHSRTGLPRADPVDVQVAIFRRTHTTRDSRFCHLALGDLESPWPLVG